MSLTADRYLHLQFKKGIHHGYIRNAELDPTPTEPVMARLEQDESCLVLVRDKRQRCLWFTNRRLLRQDSSDVVELFPYKAVQKVHWISKERTPSMPKEEFFDRLEVDVDNGGVEIDGLDQAYAPVLQFLGYVAWRRATGE